MTDRLDQTIVVTERGDRLGDVLVRLSKQTGARFYAQVPMREVRVVIRYDGPLRGFMDTLTHFFAVSKEHPAKWLNEGDDRYTLARSHEGERAAQRLVRARQEQLVQGMNQAIGSGNRWVKHLAGLTEAERLSVYSGQPVTYPADHFGGREFLKEVLVRDALNWSDDTMVTYQMTGWSPLTRMFVRKFSDPTRADIAEEGFALAQLCPGLSPEIQQKEWRLHFGDPAPTDTRRVILLDPSAPAPQAENGHGEEHAQGPQQRMSGIPRCDLFYRLAEKAKINLIADDYGQTIDESQLAASGTISELLDSLCKFLWGGGQDASTNHGSFWRKNGDTYLIRSIAWPEEEDVPPSVLGPMTGGVGAP